jgi:hypothetical protein
MIFIYIYFQVYSLHPVEIIHIIHYSILTILLGYTFDRERKNFFFTKFLVIGFFIGFFDEFLQYLVLVPAQKFLDFNDIYVNMLGSIGGLLIFYSFKPLPVERFNRREFLSRKSFLVFFIIAVFIIVLTMNGNIRFSTDHIVNQGATEIINGETVLYLERYPYQYGSYLKHFIKGYFYNLNPFEWSVLTAITLIIISSFDPRRYRWLKPLNSIRSTIKAKNDEPPKD